MNLVKSKYLFSTIRSIGNNKEVFLLFSGRTAKNIVVTQDVFYNVINNNVDCLSESIKEKLIHHKILVFSDENELVEINNENRSFLSKTPNECLYISIQPTAACQLACDYCGQAHSKKFLDESHIHSILRRIDQKLSLSVFKELRIGWFGGEPLCALNNMRILNEKLKEMANSHNVQYRGQITTNGYALSSDIYEKLKNVYNIYKIEVTLDGSKKFHDQRRVKCNGEGSFDRIFQNILSIVSSDMYDFKTCPISIRCNVDERNIEGVMPLMKLLVEKDLQSKVLFYTAPVVSWSNNGAGSEEGHLSLGKHSTDFIAYMIENGFHVGILPTRSAPYACLGTDEYAEMYDADGYIYDCSETSYSDYYAQQGYILGNVLDDDVPLNKGSKIRTVPEKLMNEEITECKECKFYPLCGGMCPLALLEGSPRCPSFIYNIEDRMFLDYISRSKNN